MYKVQVTAHFRSWHKARKKGHQAWMIIGRQHLRGKSIMTRMLNLNRGKPRKRKVTTPRPKIRGKKKARRAVVFQVARTRLE